MDPMAARGSLYDGFDTTDTSPPIAPWTTLGSPDTLTANNTTSVSQLYVAESGAGSVNLAGAYQTWSPSNGNYVETWLTDFTLSSSLSSYVGIFVGEAGGTGKFSFLGIGRYAAAYDDRAVIFQYTSRTAFGSETGSVAGPWRGPVGLRLVYNSSTSMDYWLTTGGLGWRRLVTGTNIGFTVGIAGIGGDMSASSFTTEAWFEYFNNG
jgi:hypothetical protein